MRRFTVAELEEAKTALKNLQLTVPSKNKPDSSLSIHQIEHIKKNLDPNTGGIRYTLTHSGELYLGANHNPQKALATGDLFFKFNARGKLTLTALSNYTDNVYHLFAVLAVVREHQIERVPELQFMQNDPPDTFAVPEAEVSEVLSVSPPKLTESLIAANNPKLINATADLVEDEDEYFEEVCFLEHYTTRKWKGGSSASPGGLFGAQDLKRKQQNRSPVSTADLDAILEEPDLPGYN